MKALHKYIITLTSIALVVAVVMYKKKFTENNQKLYIGIRSDDSLSLNNQNSYVLSSSSLASSSSSISLQSAEISKINFEIEKLENSTVKHEEISQVEKNDMELTEEELTKKKLALVKKYSNQLPKIYDNTKSSGKNLAGSPLDYMKKIADSGDTAAKLTYGSHLTKDFWNGRFSIRPEELDQWKLRFKESFDYFRSAAIDGSAMGAAYLGCDYFLPPYSDNLEGLTWVLISVKLGSPPCIERMPSDEKLYAQALEQARFYLDYYDFKK
jgi:hypothetical protein